MHSLNNDTVLDFGTLGIGNQRTMIFAVINENPIEVGSKTHDGRCTPQGSLYRSVLQVPYLAATARADAIWCEWIFETICV